MEGPSPLKCREASRADLTGKEEVARELERYRDRLRRSIELRLDPRMRGRVDASDVVQEALVEAVGRFAEFDERQTGGLYLWLRYLAQQRLLQLRRYHLVAEKRSVRREVRLRTRQCETSCVALADYVVDSGIVSPSSACSRQETRRIVLAALESLPPLDRETLVLRYFEELSNTDTARVLGIKESTASTRFLRALGKIKQVLEHAGDALAEQ